MKRGFCRSMEDVDTDDPLYKLGCTKVRKFAALGWRGGEVLTCTLGTGVRGHAAVLDRRQQGLPQVPSRDKGAEGVHGCRQEAGGARQRAEAAVLSDTQPKQTSAGCCAAFLRRVVVSTRNRRCHRLRSGDCHFLLDLLLRHSCKCCRGPVSVTAAPTPPAAGGRSGMTRRGVVPSTTLHCWRPHTRSFWHRCKGSRQHGLQSGAFATVPTQALCILT